MKGKERLLAILLLLTFVATASMFYYQNVYMKKQEKSSQVAVLVVKQNIAKGSEFTKDNVAAIKVDKTMVLNTYVTSFAEVKGKYAGVDLLENEVITTPRIATEKDGTNKFKITFSMKGLPPGIVQGDYIRVYLKTKGAKEEPSEIFELFNKKEVVKVLNKVSSGKPTSEVLGLELLTSDKEALSYLKAKDTGEFFVIRYNDITENDVLNNVPKFEYEPPVDVSEEDIQTMLEGVTKDVSEPLSELGTTTSLPAVLPSTVPATQAPVGQTPAPTPVPSKEIGYMVQQGDTMDNIASAHHLTVAELKGLNPGVATIAPGDKLNIEKK